MGESVRNLKVGTPAAIMTFGCYAEFVVVYSPTMYFVQQLAGVALFSVPFLALLLYMECLTYDAFFHQSWILSIQVPSKYILSVSRPDPEVVAMLTSGLTASIALEKVVVRSHFCFPFQVIYPFFFLTSKGLY